MRRFGKALAALLAVAALGAAAPRETGMTVRISQGELRGAQEGDLTVFRGVPYAAPPVGEARWRPPGAAPTWSGVRPAENFGPVCPQPPAPAIGGVAEDVAQSEDCLTINVWRPAGAREGASLPVAVWIHGGANRLGAASVASYDGVAFARSGVVFVSFNYRLGHLGWFAHPAVQAEARAQDLPFGNYGLMDQIAALRWVRDNISAFGGDAKKVTIFGESAGGAAVLNLMASPEAHGLFRAAIAQSPGGLDDPLTPELKAQESAKVAEEAGLGGATATLAEMRAAPPAAFLSMTGGLALRPVIDGRSLPRSPGAALRSGEAAPVALLIGANSAEGWYTDAATAALAVAGLGAAAAEARGLYGADAPDDLTFARNLIGDSVFVAPARAAARAHAVNAPSYLYHFDYVPPGLAAFSPGGARHGADIPFVFNRLDPLFAVFGQTPSEADRAQALAVHKAWVAFIRDGRPAAASAWPAYDAGADLRYRFGTTSGLEPVAHPDRLNWHDRRSAQLGDKAGVTQD